MACDFVQLSWSKIPAFHFDSGVITPNPFDQMVTGSMLGGYTASIKSTPPASHLYVTAGVQPCAAFYHAVEVSEPAIVKKRHILFVQQLNIDLPGIVAVLAI